MRDSIVVLGIFVADTAYRAARLPVLGETILGTGFQLGPGGKGSNQAVAAAKAGGRVRFISRVGCDDFAQMAHATWAAAGVTPDVTEDADSHTGAAFIFLEQATGNNAIIVAAGAAGRITLAEIEARADSIGAAGVFLTQLETPLEIGQRALQIARAGGARTILNPAPAADLPGEMLGLCDFVTPNETEAEALTGIAVTDPTSATAAADALRARGAGAVIVTLGAQGVLYRDAARAVHLPAHSFGPVVETTGAGDAFNGAFATALAEGAGPVEAARFGCAAASLSVTRPGSAISMASRSEIDAALASI
ncbi:MAG: ribokinase [Roseinatronobacter sp.]